MTREQRIVETFVELADTMVDDFDVVDFLHRLAQRWVELLDCSEAGLLLADAAGRLRVMASSSERSDALDLTRIPGDCPFALASPLWPWPAEAARERIGAPPDNGLLAQWFPPRGFGYATGTDPTGRGSMTDRCQSRSASDGRASWMFARTGYLR